MLGDAAQAILDTEDERKQTVRDINTKIARMKKRFREVHLAIKQGGLQERFDFNALPPVVEKIKGKRGRPKGTEVVS